MYDRDRSSRPPGLGPGLLAGAAASIAVAGAFFWWMLFGGLSGGSEHPLEFAPIEVDRARLDAERADKYEEARKALEQSPPSEFLDLVRTVNNQQFIDDADKRRETARKLSFKANDVITKTDYDAFVAAGQPLFEKCRAGLEVLLEAVRTGSVDLETAGSEPDPETFATYRTNCGKLLPTLRERGLIDSEGYWTEPTALSKAIFGILQRLRWANIINTRRPPLMQLTAYERTLLTRWRIEDPDAYDRDKREAFLTRVERNPDPFPEYDVRMARARIAFQSGDLSGAAEVLKSAIREGDGETDKYGRALKWLERRIQDDPEGAETKGSTERPGG